ncbi:NlpC/P60 family protein [Thalassobacillus sp. C254]|uniref:C40 family peptidase n=1 Tax=Thalassobacillus sp. C254 TaxID=1225341 RepID=UPI0006CF6B36|nr:NlpC/P60 family protein [Thalassobacillus sp. C254]
MKKFVISAALAGGLFLAPTAADAAFGDNTLRAGMSNGEVSQLQETLKEEGHFNHSVTGYFGPITRQAVIDFQREQNIQVDGIVGPQTFGEMNVSGNGSSTATSTSSNQTQVAGASTTSNATGIVNTAKSLQGTPYVWGGTSPSGFDCSGFVQYVFNQNGKSIPRTVSEMYNASTKVSNPQVGDLVFFETRTGPSHAGIYIGNNQFVHSGSSTGVTVASLSNSYWSQTYIGAGRI